jgi:hypothetical protein
MASAPQVIVPSYIDFSYQIPLPYSLDQNRINTIGSKINPIYATGQKWTPTQKKRAFAITCLAIAALLTLSAAIIAITTGSTTALICASIGLVGCFLSASSLIHIKPDLNDPKTRNAILAKIARIPIDKIITIPATEHGMDNILDYALLDRITGPKNPALNGLSPDARDIFYDSFAHLATSYLSIQQQKHQHAALTEQTFNNAVAPLNRWRDARNAEIEQLKQAGNAIQQSTRATRPPTRVHHDNGGPALLRRSPNAPYGVASQDARRGNHSSVAPAPYGVAGGTRRGNHNIAASVPHDVAGSDARRNHGNAGAKAVEVAGGMANFAIQVGSQLTAAQVRQVYDREIAPLKQWKARAIAQFGSFDSKVKALNLAQKYQQIFDAFQASNYQTQMAVSANYRAPVTIPVPTATLPAPSAPPLPNTALPGFAPYLTPPPPYDEL